MRLGILGPLQVVDGDRVISVGGRNLRVLLAVLVCHSNQAVSSGFLLDAIWGDEPPKTAAKNLQLYIYRLRQAIGAERVQTFPHGYGITLAADELDADIFQRLVEDAPAAGADGDPQRARTLLDRALALWRGPALADLADVTALRDTVARVTEQRLNALEELMEIDLALGAHKPVAGSLRGLVVQHPLRERMRGQLMIALYRCGRQAEALSVYQQGRAALVRELGVEPGAWLQDIHLAILRGTDPGLRPVVATSVAENSSPDGRSATPHLPAAVAGFVGRSEHLARLDALVDKDAATVVISGAAGIGKTALALHWGGTASGRFPDGQLFLDLRGYSTGPPLGPLEAVTRALRMLGVSPDRNPRHIDEAVSAYRLLTAQRRMLVVLDNASDAEAVRPLIPNGVGSVCLITSRSPLTGLIAVDDADIVVLDLLSLGEAIALLSLVVGDARINAEPLAVAQLVQICGRLPLALRIAAARLVVEPRLPIAELVEALGNDRLTALDIPGDPRASLTVALDHSYRMLDPEERRTLRLIGSTPGTDIGLAAVATLTGKSTERAVDLVRALADRHLVDPAVTDRVRMHDLVRDYARAKALAEEDAAELEAALGWLFDWYLASTIAAADMVSPNPVRLPTPHPLPPAATFTDAAQAQAWLDAEHGNLLATIDRTATTHPPTAWLLVDALRGYLVRTMRVPEWLSALDAAERAAASAPEDSCGMVQAALAFSRSSLHLLRGRLDRADEALRQATDHARSAGWRELEAATTANRGILAWRRGDLTAAAAHCEAAVSIARALGLTTVEANALGNLATVWLSLGRLRDAADRYGELIGLFARVGSTDGRGHVHQNLSGACRLLGEFDEAKRHAREAERLYEAAGEIHVEGARTALANIHLDLGEYAPARDIARAALDRARRHGNPYIEADALDLLASAQRGLGDLHTARELGEELLGRARELDNGPIELQARLNLAATELKRGALVTSIEHARRALELCRSHHKVIERATATVLLATATIATGELVEARRLVVEAERLQRRTGARLQLDEVRSLLAAPRSRLLPLR